MLIKRLLIVLVMLTVGAEYVCGQQTIADPAGKWQIVRADARLYTQEADSLLRISTLLTEADFRKVNAAVPLTVSFDHSHCVFISPGTEEEGTYELVEGGRLLYRNSALAAQMKEQPGMAMQQLPPVIYDYRLKEDGTLVLELPVSYYKDNQSGLAVKLACTCYYRKQK